MNNQFFDVEEEIIKKSPQTHMIFLVGQGGVGKSFSAKRYVLNQYLTRGKKFVFVARMTTDIQAGVLESTFYDVEEDDKVQWDRLEDKYKSKGYYRYHVRPKGSYFYIVGEKVNGDIDWLDNIGRITCITKAESFKRGTYLNFSTIIFDEFITESGYVNGDKEPSEFEKILNTLGRASNGDLLVIFTGNPDADIESNPYLYNLKLDYARLQDNTIYYFDTVTKDKTLASNVAFIKIAHRTGMLNESTANIWNTAESHMRLTGEVKTDDFIKFDPDKMPFDPEAELIVETAHLTENEYHRKVYAYFGEIWGEPAVVVLGHERYRGIPKLFCRYDKTAFREMDIPQTFRLNIPAHSRFETILKILAYIDSTKIILTDDNRNATMFNQIRINS